MSQIQKKWKNVQKIAFFLMLCGIFSNIYVIRNMLCIFQIIPWNKNTKKHEKKVLKLFFKNENWTFIFVHFLYFKKSFKKVKRFSIFFQSPKIAFLVFSNMEMYLFGGWFGIICNYLFKKNERKCYLFADEK
jgi:hypothetical protein